MQELEVGWPGPVRQVGVQIEPCRGVRRVVRVGLRPDIEDGSEVGRSRIADSLGQAHHLTVDVRSVLHHDRAVGEHRLEPVPHAARGVEFGVVETQHGDQAGGRHGEVGSCCEQVGWEDSDVPATPIDGHRAGAVGADGRVARVGHVDERDGALLSDRVQALRARAVVTQPARRGQLHTDQVWQVMVG